jgi:hypothetical protein
MACSSYLNIAISGKEVVQRAAATDPAIREFDEKARTAQPSGAGDGNISLPPPYLGFRNLKMNLSVLPRMAGSKTFLV